MQIGVYRLEARLGHGGMGTVYRAWHNLLKRYVALKILPVERTQNAHALARFQREMELIGQIDHPHVVRATDAGEASGVHYLVMEEIDGLDLARLVGRLGPLPIADACEIARQAAVGLQAVHEHGLVHRDVKPSNLMLTRSGQVKILDLGLACIPGKHVGEELTVSGLIVGTADYMAPEQAVSAHRVDIRADIYSLGCVVYKLLTGRAPYGGADYRTIAMKVEAHALLPFPPLCGDRPAASPELAATLERFIAKDPDVRYPTPAEAAAALKPFTEGADLQDLYARAASAAPDGTEQGNPARALLDPRLAALPSVTVPRQRSVWLRPGLAALGLVLLAALLLGIGLGPGRSFLRNWWIAGVGGTTPPATSSASIKEPLVEGDSERRAAIWALELGGKVDIICEGDVQPQPLAGSLPTRPFKVFKIDLTRNEKVDDAGLHNLAGLARIDSLSLHQTRITDAGIIPIAKLKSLHGLDLYHTGITDTALQQIGTLTNLRALSIHDTNITDTGLSHLRNLTELEALNLANTSVGDRGIAHLAGIQKLNWLQLKNTQVSDASVESLKQLQLLKEVHLDQTKVTENGAAALKDALPACRVVR